MSLMEFAIVNNYMGPVATKPMKGYSEENIPQATQTGSGSKVRCLLFVCTLYPTMNPHILFLSFISFVSFVVIVVREHLSSIEHRLRHNMINAAMDEQRHFILINFHGFSFHFHFSF